MPPYNLEILSFNMDWIQVFLAFITGGGINAWFNYFLNRQKNNRDTFESILKVWSEDNKRLREETLHLEGEIQKLNRIVSELQAKLIIMEGNQADLPVPMWLKDTQGTVLYVNDSYEKTFLLPNGVSKYDYIGHTDYDVWPKEIADIYTANDKATLSTKTAKYIVEKVPVNGQDELWYVVKYVRYSGGTPIGVGGIAVPNASLQH